MSTCSRTNNRTLPGANDPFLSSHLKSKPCKSVGITSPISVVMTTGISCGVRKSNKAPVATPILSINLYESVEPVTYSHHTQKCFAADSTLLDYLLIKGSLDVRLPSYEVLKMLRK